MSFGGVDEKKLAGAIIDGAAEKLVPLIEPLLKDGLGSALAGRTFKITGLLPGRSIIIEIE